MSLIIYVFTVGLGFALLFLSNRVFTLYRIAEARPELQGTPGFPRGTYPFRVHYFITLLAISAMVIPLISFQLEQQDKKARELLQRLNHEVGRTPR